MKKTCFLSSTAPLIKKQEITLRQKRNHHFHSLNGINLRTSLVFKVLRVKATYTKQMQTTFPLEQARNKLASPLQAFTPN